MRVGRNPLKTVGPISFDVPEPAEMSLTLLTHLPELAGYHAAGLGVLELAIRSARVNAGRPIHLAVFDNGSCDEVGHFLRTALSDGLVDQVISSRENVGKVNAMSQIVRGAPGHFAAYADGDLWFQPGWADTMITIATAMPEAGVVSGAPPLSFFSEFDESGALPPLGDDIVVERGRFVDEAVIRAHLREVGSDESQVEADVEKLSHDHVRLTRGDVSALLGGSHVLFLVTPEVRAALAPAKATRALDPGEDAAFEDSLRTPGTIRLSPVQPVYRHVGSRLDAAATAELARLAPARHSGTLREVRQVPANSIWRRARVRWLVRIVHDWSFRTLYEST